MIGIYGGSFNPVHYGHLIIAEHVRVEFQLEKILFIPSKEPPHKSSLDMIDSFHRYNMVLEAIDDNSNFDISDIELKREGLSYTVDTIEQLSKSNNKYCLIIGADSLIDITLWYKFESILRGYKIIVCKRPGINNDDVKEKIKQFSHKYNADISLSSAPGIEISSSEIRKRIKNGMSVRYMLPDSVKKYIQENNLEGV